MDATNDIGKTVRLLRGEMSLRDFAEKCDVSHTTIDNLEKGIDFRTGKPTQVKMTTLQKIADACNVPISYIINESPTPTPEAPQLSEGEQLLLDMFRQIPEEQQKVFLEMGRVYANSLKKD